MLGVPYGASALNIRRRGEVLVALGQGVGRVFDGLLENHVHEQEERLGFHHQDEHLTVF